MKHPKHFFSFLFFLLTSTIFGQTLFKNQLNFGFELINFTSLSFDVIENNEGDYIINTGNFENSLIIKVQSDGTTLWAKRIEDGLGGTPNGTHLLHLPDNGFMLTTAGSSHKYYKILRFDEDAELLWSRYLGAGSGKNGSTIQTNDNGFALIGHMNGNSFGLTDIFFAKMDSLGQVEWAKNYGTSLYERGRSVHQLDNGDFLISAHQGLMADVVLMRVDSEGEIIFSKTLGIHGIEAEAREMIRLSDGNFVIRGTDGASSFNGMVVKVSEFGDIIWAKQVDNISLPIIRMNTCKDGGFLTFGTAWNPDISSSKNVITKFDTDGNVIWTSAVSNTNPDHRFVGELSNGDIISLAENTLADSLVLIKISKDGMRCDGENAKNPIELFDIVVDTMSIELMTNSGFLEGENPMTISDFSFNEDLECALTNTDNLPDLSTRFEVFPNPANNELFIQFSEEMESGKNIEISIFDTNGRLIKEENTKQFNFNKSLNINKLQSGFYILKLSIDGDVGHKKFLKL